MSDQDTIQAPSELEMLKKRADVMSIKYSNNISLETLKARVQAKMDGEPDPTAGAEINALDVEGEDTAAAVKPETKQELRTRLHRECMALVRVRITNLDPKKKELQGEIFCVANKYIGTVKKFIPYGEASEAGFHLPRILYDELNSRKFLDIRTSKKAGQIHVSQKWSREFALEVLPQLTQQELAHLAASQAASRSVD